MTIANRPSKLSLPASNAGYATVLDYLIAHFPRISGAIWLQRMAAGKVHWHDGTRISAQTLFRPRQRVYYYREVAQEIQVPFAEQILYQDRHILVADKPHFLPVTPGGRYVDECLQNRLRRRTGLEFLQALHRLDRPTAGLVLFSVNPETRHLYHSLFESRQIDKRYQAVASVEGNENRMGQQWRVVNRIERSEPRFLMRVTAGKPNSCSHIYCLDQRAGRALFELRPVTGKTHQLRLHMASLGWPILNDRYYPVCQPEAADDYNRPLQLLAQQLRFVDPVTRQTRNFESARRLQLG